MSVPFCKGLGPFCTKEGLQFPRCLALSLAVSHQHNNVFLEEYQGKQSISIAMQQRTDLEAFVRQVETTRTL
jgi:hypothetical protein